VLVRVLQAGDQPPPLLLERDVEHDLEEADAAARQLGLEAVDLRVAALDHVVRCEAVDAGDQDVLVVRAVEDAEQARPGRGATDAPEEVVAELLGRRRLERLDADALGVEPAHHVLDGPVLAAGVHALEHDEHGAALLGPEPLLELLQLGQHVLEVPGGGAPADAVPLAGIELGEAERPPVRRRPEQVTHGGGLGAHEGECSGGSELERLGGPRSGLRHPLTGLAGGGDPGVPRALDLGHRFLRGPAERGARVEVRDVGDPATILDTEEDVHVVPAHRRLLSERAYRMAMRATCRTWYGFAQPSTSCRLISSSRSG